MNTTTRIEILKQVDIFAALKKRDLKLIAKSTTEEVYEPGAALCRQGDRGVAAFIILEGTVAVEEELHEGRVIEIATLEPGSVVGELALIDGAPRVATVRAKTDSRVLVLTTWDFRALLKRQPAMAGDILPVVVRRLRNLAIELRKTDDENPRFTIV